MAVEQSAERKDKDDRRHKKGFQCKTACWAGIALHAVEQKWLVSEKGAGRSDQHTPRAKGASGAANHELCSLLFSVPRSSSCSSSGRGSELCHHSACQLGGTHTEQ